MSNGSSVPKFKDVIDAVHGIGQQSRYSTVRSVATRFAASKTLLAGSPDQARPVATQPLSYFHREVSDFPSVSLLDEYKYLANTPLAATGFAEVFWADITEKAIKEGSTLEETKAWARTVVARAQALWIRENTSETVNEGDPQRETNARGRIIASAHALLMRVCRQRTVPPDFGLVAEVLDEIIRTIYVLKKLLLQTDKAGVYILENLAFLAENAELFNFNLSKLLEDYLSGEQIVTEIADYLTEILARFHQTLTDIYEEQIKNGNDKVRLHIVAHSEGTVISFLGLLQAMSGQQLITPTSPKERPTLENTGQIPKWLKHVHGFMTIGSPIDRHLLLWPQLWNQLTPSLADADLPASQIRWRNYYDYGDPVGSKLATARSWLDQQGSKAFEFCDCPAHRHDIGFARYLLPDKAHIEYWDDPDVFEHFFDDVIRVAKEGDPPAKRPTDNPAIRLLSPALPYFISWTLLVFGVFLLCEAVDNFMHTDDPLTNFFLITAINVERTAGMSGWDLFFNTLGIAGLIAGTTLFARIPRLAAGWRWKIAGWVAFVTGCAYYITLVSDRLQRELGKTFICLAERLGFGSPDKISTIDSIIATTGIILVAMAVGELGSLVTRHSKQVNEDLRKRWILNGMRPLILCGACAVLLIVDVQLYPHGFGLDTKMTAEETRQLSQLSKENREIIKAAGFDHKELDQLLKAYPDPVGLDKRIARVKPLLFKRQPVWPILLAAAGFLYLWWLATMIFDLAFVWQRYVRRSIANQRLREWGPQELRRSGDDPDRPEACRNPEHPSSENGEGL